MGKLKVVELGCAGHLVVARDCQWSRHTQIGDSYRVSTIGNYYPSVQTNTGPPQRQPLGFVPDSFFETMVFETIDKLAADSENCGCHEVKDWTEIDFRGYATAGEAQLGHEQMVEKYRKCSEEKMKCKTTPN